MLNFLTLFKYLIYSTITICTHSPLLFHHPLSVSSPTTFSIPFTALNPPPFPSFLQSISKMRECCQTLYFSCHHARGSLPRPSLFTTSLQIYFSLTFLSNWSLICLHNQYILKDLCLHVSAISPGILCLLAPWIQNLVLLISHCTSAFMDEDVQDGSDMGS